jgi:uncharacterized OB-fold protein
MLPFGAPTIRGEAQTLATRMGEVVAGKCPSCGKIERAPKAMLIEQMKCPDCHVDVSFVLVGVDSSGAAAG